MTGSDNNPSRPPLEAETQASLRADILRQISATRADLAKALAQLGTGDASRIQIALQLTNLSALSQQVSGANEASLQRMQAEVAATIAAAQSLADAGAGNGADAGAATPLTVANANARRTAQNFVTDFYEKHEFDKHLEFKSDEDARAYREREAERLKEIKEALARNTTQSNQRVLQLEQEQLKDAGDHGADKSPDFQSWKDQLNAQAATLQQAATKQSEAPSAPDVTTNITSTKSEQPVFAVDPNIMAALKSSGVVVADQSQQGHGVSADQAHTGTVRTV